MKKTKILVIEDDRAVSELLTHILEGQNYEVSAAYDGIEGLNKVKSFEPELIILDINMPLMDGWQLLQALQSSPKTMSVPILMCTERTLMKEVEQALAMGASGYIMKPFSTERVLSKVNDALGPSISD
jgi:DNA-binding response OmpR family regulator